MASAEAAYGGSGGGHYRLHLDSNEISVDTANNRSLVRTTLYMRAIDNWGAYNFAATPGSINVDGTGVGGSTAYDSRGSLGPWYIVNSYDQWVAHNADGTRSITVSGSHDAQDSPLLTTASVSLTLALTTINRYATITGFSISNITDVGFRITTSTDVTCDLLEYSLDGGSSWTSVTGTFTSKNVDVTGLKSGTGYTVLVRVRRQDSQLKTTSSSTVATTLNATNFFFGGVV